MSGLKIKSKNYSFEHWIPEGAKFCLRGLRYDETLENSDFQFVSPFFEDENLKDFLVFFSKEDRFFFLDLLYPLIRARKELFRRQERHVEARDLKEDAKSLKNQVTKMQETLDAILNKKHFKTFLFEKFPPLLSEMSGYILDINKQLKEVTSKVGKNKYRPANRKSLDVVGKSEKEKLQIEAAYCARCLSVFFDERLGNTLKSSQRKIYICDIVNALVDLEDHPITPQKLNDLKRLY